MRPRRPQRIRPRQVEDLPGAPTLLTVSRVGDIAIERSSDRRGIVTAGSGSTAINRLRCMVVGVWGNSFRKWTL
jgi:hypothetical protein